MKIVEIEKQSTQERTLAENTVFSKSFDKDTVQKIKDLLIPSKGQSIPYDTAYGVFLAYKLMATKIKQAFEILKNNAN